tara:strand:- start:3465 stop:3689 length:225 start_codon:yes stop_codon:yes gene_type:complete
MFEFDEILLTTIIIYLGTCYFLYNLKHPKMFDEKGNFKCFGLNKNETIFPFWLVTTIIGLFTYYILIIRKEFYL